MIHTCQVGFFINAPSQDLKEGKSALFELKPPPSSASAIKHFVAPISIYLGSEIIFNLVTLHPAAGKLQPSLCGASICSGYALPSKTKGNSSFPDVFGVASDENLQTFFLFVLFVSFCSQGYSLCFFLCVFIPAPNPFPPSCYFLCHLGRAPASPQIASVPRIFNYDLCQDVRLKAAELGDS